jgi:hypothetical protein
MKKYILSSLIFFLLMNTVIAQNNSLSSSKTDSNTGVRVSTIVRQLPTLSEQVVDMEKKLAEAESDSKMHENGTVLKYKLVLDMLRKELEAENAERMTIIATENK